MNLKEESLPETESVPAGTGVACAAELYAFPASPQQQQLWFLDQLEPGNPAYNIPLAYELRGELSVAALDKAFSWVLNRHETFRTRLVLIGEQLQQVVDPERPFALEKVDLRPLPQAEREAKSRALVSEAAAARFDLAAGPLARGLLILLESRRHVVMFNFHHAILDHLSVLQFAREFCAAYAAFRRNKTPGLAPPALHYPDFSVWQEEQLREPGFQEDLRKWVGRLADAPASLSLPLDRPRPSMQSFAGRELKFSLPAPLSERIRELARSSKKSVYVTLLTAFKCLLARYAGQEDIVVGSPFSNRTVGDLEGVMGCCMNTLPLYSKLGGARTFREALDVVQQTVIEAHTRQRVPLKAIVDASQLERSPGVNPFFQVLLVVQDPPMTLQIEGAEVTPLAVHNNTSKFNFSVWMWDAKEGISGLWEFNADLFSQPAVVRLLASFETLLGAVVEQPDNNWRGLPMLPASERRLLLGDWNSSETAYPAGKCIHELVWAQVERTPGAVAVMCGDARWSYRELRERAVAVAGSLRSLGVGPGALVGVFVERSAELVAAVLGVLQSGAAYVPMDPLFPRERLGWMIEDAAMPVIVTQTSLVETLPPNQAKLLCLDEPLPETQDPRPETQTPRSAFRVPLSEDPAYVIFTSGSTGRPKGVVVEHRGVVNVLQSICREPGFTEEDTMLSVTTLSFDIAVAELFLPLITGGRLVLAERATAADGHRLRSLLETCGATFLQPTPVTWRLLLEAGWPGSPDLKMICTGEPLPPDLAAQLLPKGKSLWNLYGPTETTIWSTGCQITDAAGITIGRPLANTQVYIVNEALQLQPVGVPGELLIGGDGVARGYLNRPELTAEKFIPNPFGAGRVYRTGDLARWRADGTLECLGRLDHQVKVRGYRIELGEIEAALALAEGVRQAVVVLREEQLVAYVVPAAAAPSEPMLREHLRGKLPEYMVPARYVTLDKLPLTPNGKIDRQALPEPAGQDAGAPAAAAAAPRNEVERKLVEILGTLLKRQRIGIHDNFFDLGGHSLLVLRMISAVNEHFGCDLPPITLFENPTVASFAAILKPPVPPAPQPVIEPASTPPAMKQPGGATNNGVLRAVAEAIQRGSGSSTAREEAKCPYRMRESWVCKHVLAPLYRRRNSLRLDIKPGIRKLILRLEGGPLFTITLRRLLSEVHKIQIGDYSAASFDPYHLRAGTKIGRYCAIDETVFIRDEDHPRNTISTHAIFFLKRVGFSSGHKLPRANLEIGNDVWVGHGAKILYPTSKIGDGAVIGAGAVVVEDVPPFAIVAGVPARVVKYRFSKETISELQSLKWWDYSLERLAPASDQFMMPIEGDRIY